MPKRKPLEVTYLASPFSHPDERIQIERVRIAQRACLYLILYTNQQVFSPVVHCYPLFHAAQQLGLQSVTGSFSYWRNYNRAMIDRCDSLTVLKTVGWETSKGVKAEIVYALSLNKPVISLEYSDVIKWLTMSTEKPTVDVGVE